MAVSSWNMQESVFCDNTLSVIIICECILLELDNNFVPNFVYIDRMVQELKWGMTDIMTVS